MANRPLNVWIVDDDQSVRWVLEKALKQADMETRSFERAEHLLEAIADGEPDVLITDVRMPGMSGLALRAFGPRKRGCCLQRRRFRILAQALRH